MVMCRWIVRFATRMPSFRSSPRIRSAPQRTFSAAMRWMSAMTSKSTREVRLLELFDFQHQKSRNPSRCQRSTVSGFTSRRAFCQCCRRLASWTTKPRSGALKIGRLTFLDATMSCWRSRAFSISNSVRERVTSVMRPASTGRGRLASRIASRTRLNIRPAAARRCRMMLANTRPICSKPAGSSRLVLNENLNDHAAEDACSQYRSQDHWGNYVR